MSKVQIKIQITVQCEENKNSEYRLTSVLICVRKREKKILF